MKIRNFDALATTPNRRAALEIAEAGLQAIDTDAVIRRAVALDGDTLRVAGETMPLSSFKHLFVVGAGKCAARAAATLETILGGKISGGAVLDVQQLFLKRVTSMKGDHPYPTERNVAGTKKIIDVLKSADEGDLVIAIVSGGGSALLAAPPDEWTVEKEAAIVQALFKAGADIVELNTIRKHLSRARGGSLATYAYPSRVTALVLSDVPGDKLEFISSGPFMKDTTTVEDARAIVQKYRIEAAVGFPITSFIETPKDDEHFKKVRHELVVSNLVGLLAMEAAAKKLGFSAAIRDTAYTGEARDLANTMVAELHAAPPKSALLWGGESTVTIKVDGEGGRNQELALAALPELKKGEAFLTVASDGHDNTDAAGALCDTITMKTAKSRGFNAAQILSENNSYKFFAGVGDQLKTGETGSNVADFVVAIKE